MTTPSTTDTQPQTAASGRTGRAASGMPGLGTLITTEFKIYGRDFGNIFFVLAFPTVLLLGIGLIIPGLRDTITDAGPPWDGLQPVHLLVPVMVAVAVASAGLSSLPTYLASYREKGVLRRLSTTPMAPQGILIALILVNLFWLTLGAALSIAVGIVVLDVPLPVDWWILIVAFPLTITSCFGIGLIIGGIVRKASVAGGIGMLVFFPMMFFAGLWTPGPAMPDTLATIATWTPLGAAGQALTTAWFGDGGFPSLQFVSMGLWTVVTFAIAAKTFRWK